MVSRLAIQAKALCVEAFGEPGFPRPRRGGDSLSPSAAVGAAAWAGYLANPRPYKRRYNYPLLVQLQQGLSERLTKR